MSIFTQGPNLPTVATGNTGGGAVSWLNPTRIELADGLRASVNLGNGSTSHMLIGTGFGFTIPSGAVINGIQLDVDELSTIGDILSVTVQILKAGVPAGNNKAGVPIGEWPQSLPANVTYGGPNDLWGLINLLPADINDPNFGVQIDVRAAGGADTASCDYYKLTISYTLAQIFSVISTE